MYPCLFPKSMKRSKLKSTICIVIEERLNTMQKCCTWQYPAEKLESLVSSFRDSLWLSVNFNGIWGKIIFYITWTLENLCSFSWKFSKLEMTPFHIFTDFFEGLVDRFVYLFTFTSSFWSHFLSFFFLLSGKKVIAQNALFVQIVWLPKSLPLPVRGFKGF